jgi:sulfur relay (sulfurtransferase) complex TusBCD TusD component (DsrE family)
MAKTLGILVCTPKYFHHVMQLAQAARRAAVDLRVFFTGEGVALTQHPSFPELAAMGRVKICDVSYKRLGYTGTAPGLDKKDHSNQLEHALMVSEVDRYLVF